MWYVVLFLLGAMAGVFVIALANAASCRDCELRINTADQEENDDTIS